MRCFLIAFIFPFVLSMKPDYLEFLEDYDDYLKPKSKVNYTRNNACFGDYMSVVSLPLELYVDHKRCNLKFSKDMWKKEPIVRYNDVVTTDLFAMVMVDPDVPGLKEDEYYLHWLVVNILGCELADGYIERADKIIRYKPIAPARGTGFHKYQFLIYQQSGIIPKCKFSEKQRNRFKLFDWLKSRAPKRFYGPLSGVQFQADFNSPGIESDDPDIPFKCDHMFY
uniref:Phosphatidylethanolamine-binding protein n=1 Tax=Clastoptera arizonana TaxID=38151 RepID=A0A1B6DB80_9HEMI